MARPRRRVAANLRYFIALLARFKVTLLMAAGLFLFAPLIFTWLYVAPDQSTVRYGQAFHHVYFLMFGQPSLPYVDNLLLESLNLIIPPFGIAVVVDGIVRFTYLYFAKHRDDKEWIQVISETMKDHVVICGAGRVGYRVASELLALEREIVVIEKNQSAAFVTVLRDKKIPVLIDDIRSAQCLTRTNVERAWGIVCATDDDLANLNVALDARRLNPRIRVVIRLFDDDLVSKVRDTFRAEALSSSALAAPAMALAALDPRIVHSFHVSGHLMVVSNFLAQRGLAGMSISELRDRFGVLALAHRHAGATEQLHPGGEVRIAAGDLLTIQSEYRQYLKLREHTGEVEPPLSLVQ